MSKHHNNFNDDCSTENINENDALEINEECSEPDDEEITCAPLPIGIVKCERLNVRKSSDIDSSVMAVIENGDEVTIYPDKSTGEWYCVETESGIIGFCMKEFIAWV